MSSPINIQLFDPFKQVLADGQRLKFENGILTVEDSTVRRSTNAWIRFWTRGQYSQSAILNEMTKLYERAQQQLGMDEQRTHFITNFTTLKTRATTQNQRYEDKHPIIRFFKAKSFIDVAAIDAKFLKMDQAIVNATNQNIQTPSQNVQIKDQMNHAGLIESQKEADAIADRLRQERQTRLDMVNDNIAKLQHEIDELEANYPLNDELITRYQQEFKEQADGMSADEVLFHAEIRYGYAAELRCKKDQLKAEEIKLSLKTYY